MMRFLCESPLNHACQPSKLSSTMAAASEPAYHLSAIPYTLREINTTCTVAEFNQNRGVIYTNDENGEPTVPLVGILGLEGEGILYLNERRVGPLGGNFSEMMPELTQRIRSKSACTLRTPMGCERYHGGRCGTVRAADPDHPLQAKLLSYRILPHQPFISVMHYDRVRIEEAEPAAVLQVRGFNASAEVDGEIYWMFT